MSAAPTVATLLRDATGRLADALALDRSEARIEARALLAHALKVDHAWLIAHDRDTPAPALRHAIESLIVRRAGGEPVAYIIGEREFFGLNFVVGPAVLIPRPDTELLVEAALQRLPEHPSCRILDLGTGSGAIAIALARRCPSAEVVAVDVSADALAIAQANARRLGAANLHCMAGDWYAGLGIKKFDLIVSNPPYIASADPHLSAGDLRFEPLQALASGDDGLRDIRRIVAGAPAHLADQGWLLLEHGFEQAGAVVELLQQHGFEQTCTLRDLAGLNRVSGGRWPNQPNRQARPGLGAGPAG
ncbi:MAG: protein-(glutamine-N5) methyltransferase, release factor-specific [Hydrogenophilales bacterium 28-61-23]|nr:MAG: protein-(glutamine-N5) methyltransferase, release factor-specific [Hydrogenophilales bacterium 28-61-23]